MDPEGGKKEKDMAENKRRQFFAALVGGSVVVWLSGCGGDPDNDRDVLDGSVRISSNHGHQLDIPAADLNSTIFKDYDIRGTADHSHTVRIDPDEFQRIKEGQVVAIGSSLADNGDGHSHSITANPVI